MALYQLIVCANSVGVCVHQMNKYLPHAYISKRTKGIKELYIQEHKKNKRETKNGESHDKTLHKIKWPLSLKIVPSGVANCHNLPFGGRERVTRGCIFQERNTCGVATNVYFRKMSEKPEKTWSTNFKWKVQELYLRTGKVLAPYTSITRDGSL